MHGSACHHDFFPLVEALFLYIWYLHIQCVGLYWKSFNLAVGLVPILICFVSNLFPTCIMFTGKGMADGERVAKDR